MQMSTLIDTKRAGHIRMRNSELHGRTGGFCLWLPTQVTVTNGFRIEEINRQGNRQTRGQHLEVESYD